VGGSLLASVFKSGLFGSDCDAHDAATRREVAGQPVRPGADERNCAEAWMFWHLKLLKFLNVWSIDCHFGCRLHVSRIKVSSLFRRLKGNQRVFGYPFDVVHPKPRGLAWLAVRNERLQVRVVWRAVCYHGWVPQTQVCAAKPRPVKSENPIVYLADNVHIRPKSTHSRPTLLNLTKRIRHRHDFFKQGLTVCAPEIGAHGVRV